MKIGIISDTHEQHEAVTPALKQAGIDVLVHCGDITGVGHPDAFEAFVRWCAHLKKAGVVKEVVATAGNHDVTLDPNHPRIKRAGMEYLCTYIRRVFEEAGVHLLLDRELTLDGVVFYGSPWTPRFHDWAFQIDTPSQDRWTWARVPDHVDVLITHGPPRGILDLARDERTGSVELLKTVQRVKPQVHAFGHIHEQYGVHAEGGTLFVNAATCTRDGYRPENPPVIVDVVPRAKGG